MGKKKIEQFISRYEFKREDLAKLSYTIQEEVLKGATHYDVDDSAFSSDKSYDYSFEFYSYRDETDAEFETRKEASLRARIAMEQVFEKKEHEEYLRLKAKFDNK